MGEDADPFRGFRLLLVEDEPLVLMSLQDVVENLGCVVVGTASSLSEALAAIDTGSAFDAALLDVQVGREKIWPAADRLMSLSIPFAFLSGYTKSGIEARFLSMPIIDKPFSDAAVKSAVLALCAAAEQKSGMTH